jgi:hypothetical protein
MPGCGYSETSAWLGGASVGKRTQSGFPPTRFHRPRRRNSQRSHALSPPAMALGKPSGTQPASGPAESLEGHLARVSEMNIEQLRACWRGTTPSDPPAAFSKDLLARAICYRLQEQVFGSLSASTVRRSLPSQSRAVDRRDASRSARS